VEAMMSRSFLYVVPALIVLSACGTPQQQCINTVTKDLRTVDNLIQTTQANISRGYAYTDVVKSMPQYVDCTPHATKDNPDPKGQMCLVDTATTFREPVAIDLAAEQTKLTQLLAKRDALTKQAAAPIASCQATYPE
jgi:hypothetical protein